MKHVVFLEFTINVIYKLLIRFGAQCNCGQTLRLTAGEEGAAVGTRQNAFLDSNGADLTLSPAVGSLPFVQDPVAECTLHFIGNYSLDDLLLLREILFKCFHDFILNSIHG